MLIILEATLLQGDELLDFGVEMQRLLICVQSSSTEISNMATKVELVYLLIRGLYQVLSHVSACLYQEVQV